jgi:hypothetical protein
MVRSCLVWRTSVVLVCSLLIGGCGSGQDNGTPIIAVKTSRNLPPSRQAGLKACREQIRGKNISEAVKRKVRNVCARAAHDDLKGVDAAVLTACVLVARETGDLNACGFKIVTP